MLLQTIWKAWVGTTEKFRGESGRLLRGAKSIRTRNVAGWVVLSVLPVINAFAKPYIFHFLTRDYYRHERYEELILKCLSSKFPKLQLVNFEYPDRDTVMYFLLSAITLGIFWIYWMYTLFSDPNRHFKEHRVFEELLLEELS